MRPPWSTGTAHQNLKLSGTRLKELEPSEAVVITQVPLVRVAKSDSRGWMDAR